MPGSPWRIVRLQCVRGAMRSTGHSTQNPPHAVGHSALVRMWYVTRWIEQQIRIEDTCRLGKLHLIPSPPPAISAAESAIALLFLVYIGCCHDLSSLRCNGFPYRARGSSLFNLPIHQQQPPSIPHISRLQCCHGKLSRWFSRPLWP